MSVLIVGSVALDDIATPAEAHKNLLGGSASYAAISASYFSPVQFVGIVGKDFPEEHLAFIKSRNIDLEGLQIADGETFRWSGKYHDDMNSRETLSVALNVFETFSPNLPTSYQDAGTILLANISPELQHHVLDQIKNPGFVIADTMDLWIDIAKDSLIGLLARIDILILNDGEARQLTGEPNLMLAGKKIQSMGPKYVAIKKGEHGCLLFGENEIFSCPAFPLEEMLDPTGAGDTFAGGLAGHLAESVQVGKEVNFEDLKKGVVYGSVLASFNVERFSLERMKSLELSEVQTRLQKLKAIADFGEI
ncbi:MAG: PfkB family carbohydrate kinase [Chthoniobacterales bacterium]